MIKTGILDGDGFERIVPKVELFTGRRPKWVGKVDGAVQREEGWKVKGEE